MEFSRPENWSGWPFLSLGDLPNPGISVGKESACSAGDLYWLPGPGYPLKYSYTSPVAQLLKNLWGHLPNSEHFFSNLNYSLYSQKWLMAAMFVLCIFLYIHHGHD